MPISLDARTEARSQDDLSDDELVRRIRAGDDGAFEAAFRRYCGPLVGFCTHMLRSREEAEDAVQHTFISALKDLRRTDKPIELRPWLYRIAQNRCISMLRARRPAASIDEAYHVPATEGVFAQAGRRQEFRQLLADLQRLPDDQRAALVLAQLGDLTGDEIGEVLECSPNRVRALVFQARRSLMADRDARELACREVQETLAGWTGGLSSELRRHVELCPSCEAFRTRSRAQRAALAAVLPVAPSKAFAETGARVALDAARPAGQLRRLRGPATAAGVVAALLITGGVLASGSDRVPARASLASASAAPSVPSRPSARPARVHRRAVRRARTQRALADRQPASVARDVLAGSGSPIRRAYVRVRRRASERTPGAPEPSVGKTPSNGRLDFRPPNTPPPSDPPPSPPPPSDPPPSPPPPSDPPPSPPPPSDPPPECNPTAGCIP
ncbi:MAG: RNA polymerase sigma factor [Solirubrobacteraceae bacterium]